MTDNLSPKKLSKRVKIAILTFLCVFGNIFPCKAAYDFPFQDPQKKLNVRVDDLLSRLTMEEKISLLHQWQPAIPRLGIGPFRTGTEALHGAAWLGKATVFPQAIGLGATWNRELVEQIGSAVADEVRVLHQKDPMTIGLSVWAPVVDLLRDPRAGRTEEGYSEDPFLTGNISMAYCAGLKGDHPFYYKTIPTLKHFYAYNQETNRNTVNVLIDDRNKHEYYLEAFRYAIAGGQAKSLMTSYNIVNDIPCTVHPDINAIVKSKWVRGDFFVVSDAWAPAGLVQDQHYYDTMPKAMAGALLAGVDSMTQDGEDSQPTIEYITTALNNELITEEDIDAAARHILTVRFHTGEFDPDDLNPYADIPETELCHPDHAKLANTAAREAVVLLKNEADFLPLNKDRVTSVAVIGPLGDQVLTDFYSAPFPYTKTILDEIRKKIPAEEVIFTRGLDQISLRSPAGDRYLSAPAEGAQLTADAEMVGANEIFDLYDYGWGQFLLRSHANDRYLTGNGNNNALLANTASSPGVHPEGIATQQWFTYQNFRYEILPDHSRALYNYQVSHWDTGYEGGKYASVNPDPPHGLSCTQEIVGPNETFQADLQTDGLAAAVEAAVASEAAVVVVGNEPMLNARETIDREDITLPPHQEDLIEKVAQANPNTIVILVSSYPMAIGAVKKNPNVRAILYTAHGGQEEGSAVADVLFGDYNPAGRLTMTWYDSVNQLTEITDYDVIGGNRTYMYFKGTPLYPFGYGLSYTDFKYRRLKLNSRWMRPDGKITVSVNVQNVGDTAGDEVVQMYVKDMQASVKRPQKELLGFERVSLAAGQTKRVTFTVPAEELAYWDETKQNFAVEPGSFKVMVGGSSEDIRREAVFRVIK